MMALEVETMRSKMIKTVIGRARDLTLVEVRWRVVQLAKTMRAGPEVDKVAAFGSAFIRHSRDVEAGQDGWCVCSMQQDGVTFGGKKAEADSTAVVVNGDDYIRKTWAAG